MSIPWIVVYMIFGGCGLNRGVNPSLSIHEVVLNWTVTHFCVMAQEISFVDIYYIVFSKILLLPLFFRFCGRPTWSSNCSTVMCCRNFFINKVRSLSIHKWISYPLGKSNCIPCLSSFVASLSIVYCI